MNRNNKMEMLMKGEIDAVQVYDVMETLKMEQEKIGFEFVSLDNLNGSKLGYGQMLFAPTDIVTANNKKDLELFFLILISNHFYL